MGNNIPISTFRRIVTLKGNPQPETVIKIFITLGFDNELTQYMKKYHPDIAAVMSLKNSHNQEYEYVGDGKLHFPLFYGKSLCLITKINQGPLEALMLSVYAF